MDKKSRASSLRFDGLPSEASGAAFASTKLAAASVSAPPFTTALDATSVTAAALAAAFVSGAGTSAFRL